MAMAIVKIPGISKLTRIKNIIATKYKKLVT